MDEQIQTQAQTQVPQSGSMPKFVMPVVVAALLVFAVVGFYLYNNSSQTAPSTMESNSAPAASNSTLSDAAYKDGTYEMNGNYVSPGGPREVGVTLTLAGGVLTDASAEVLATDATSIRFQTEFVENFKPMVVGKNIDEVVLEKVSGSSLTPKGFNDAINKIKNAAANS